MTLILGIDPGSRITGYGVVRDTGRSCEYIASGCIRTGSGSMPERLQIVFRGVREVIETYGPVTMGIEQVFMARNPDSALKLVQKPQIDASDALAIALCHAHHRQSLIPHGLVGAKRRAGRLRL